MHFDLNFIYAGLAALFAGFVNAIAGGGTLITFPLLIALGIQPVTANITNTIALCPGYLGGTIIQYSDLKLVGKNFWLYLISGVLGGLMGAFILISTEKKIFSSIVPYLIALGSILLAIQQVIKNKILKKGFISLNNKALIVLLTFLASIYGGYFGAGLGVILLSILGMYLNYNLNKINALKQAISLCVNITAACLFIFSGLVNWDYVLIMSICSLLGGILGGHFIKHLNSEVFRWIVVIVGFIIAIIFFIK
ncbi:MAG TPA: sulfite exporter TauE/SafE family protein [Bacteroidales bacterium]|nr:sulfite exporter TauE/SafE family protein [Bacteroidales bacterium]